MENNYLLKWDQISIEYVIYRQSPDNILSVGLLIIYLLRNEWYNIFFKQFLNSFCVCLNKTLIFPFRSYNPNKYLHEFKPLQLFIRVITHLNYFDVSLNKEPIKGAKVEKVLIIEPNSFYEGWEVEHGNKRVLTETDETPVEHSEPLVLLEDHVF